MSGSKNPYSTWICHLCIENVTESARAKTAGVTSTKGDGGDLRVVDGSTAIRQTEGAGVAGDGVVVQVVHEHRRLPRVTNAKKYFFI